MTSNDISLRVKKLVTKCGLISNKLTKDKLVDLYYQQKNSLEDIAKEYNCTRQMVKLLMEKYGLTRRKRSDARVLAIKRGKFDRLDYHDIDEDFFGQWTPEMAWVLGLLFTDGNVQRRGTRLSISISSVDLDLLENISRFLKTTRPIRKCIQSYDKTRHIYQLEFYREKMRDDLHNLGLIEKKSLIIGFPDVPDEYIRHFIRGCWDGDGSVYITGEKIKASYVTGSKAFIERLVEELCKKGICRKRPYSESKREIERLRSIYPVGKYPLKISTENRSKSPAYTIKINSKESMERLFYYFYAGVDESMYLKRKYDVFVKGLNLTEEELILQRETKFEYTFIPIRPFSIEPQPKISRKIKEAKTNKKVLKINNSDGKLRCFKCGKVSEVIYVISQPYCPNCLSNSNF